MHCWFKNTDLLCTWLLSLFSDLCTPYYLLPVHAAVCIMFYSNVSHTRCCFLKADKTTNSTDDNISEVVVVFFFTYIRRISDDLSDSLDSAVQMDTGQLQVLNPGALFKGLSPFSWNLNDVRLLETKNWFESSVRPLSSRQQVIGRQIESFSDTDRWNQC